MGLLKWALIFFIIALIAAFFGFTGISDAATGVSKILFYIFLAVFIILLLAGIFGNKRYHH